MVLGSFSSWTPLLFSSKKTVTFATPAPAAVILPLTVANFYVLNNIVEVVLPAETVSVSEGMPLAAAPL